MLYFGRSYSEREGWKSLYLFNTQLRFPRFNIVYSSDNLYEFGDEFFKYLKRQDKEIIFKFKKDDAHYIEVIKDTGPIQFNHINYAKQEDNDYFVLFINGLKRISSLEQLEKRFYKLTVFRWCVANGYRRKDEKIEFEDKENRYLLNHIFQNWPNKLSDDMYMTLRLMKENGHL